MKQYVRRSFSTKLLAVLLVVPLLMGAGLVVSSVSGDEQLLQRTMMLSSSQTGASATYNLSFGLTSPETLGSIRLQFCDNDPLIDTPCSPPNGFSDSSATLSNQSGETGFSISPTSTANVLILSRIPSAATPQTVSYTFDNIMNPSSTGSYYVRVQTYASVDASGGDNDYGGLAFSMSDLVQISAEVPPYMGFCVAVAIGGYDCTQGSGNYINFGNINATRSSSSTSQMVITTNAGSGYNIQVTGSTLTSGNNVIAAMSSPDISRPGTPQFGMNLVANSDPTVGADPVGPGAGMPTASYGDPNMYLFRSNDIVAMGTQPEDYRKYTSSYLVNIPKDQSAGVYTSTLTYVSTANF